MPPSSTRLARICFWVAFAARSVLFVSAPSAALNWVKACEELGSGLGLGVGVNPGARARLFHTPYNAPEHPSRFLEHSERVIKIQNTN